MALKPYINSTMCQYDALLNYLSKLLQRCFIRFCLVCVCVCCNFSLFYLVLFCFVSVTVSLPFAIVKRYYFYIQLYSCLVHLVSHAVSTSESFIQICFSWTLYTYFDRMRIYWQETVVYCYQKRLLVRRIQVTWSVHSWVPYKKVVQLHDSFLVVSGFHQNIRW